MKSVKNGFCVPKETKKGEGYQMSKSETVVEIFKIKSNKNDDL